MGSGFSDALGDLGLDSLLSHNNVSVPQGGPVYLSVDSILEDPDQPRKHFDENSLMELASTIGKNGVKSPISVKECGDGKFIINHGARRYRATLLRGFQTIPAFIDNDYSEDDQVIENIQRDELTPREIAEYINRKVKAGLKKGDIAKKLGKSNAYISQHVTLLDLPEAIADIFNDGRCNDVTVINDLVRLHDKNPKQVNNFLTEQEGEVTRTTLKEFKEFLQHEEESKNGTGKVSKRNAIERSEASLKPNKAILDVIVNYDDRDARLILETPPSQPGTGWIMFRDTGEVEEVSLSNLTIVELDYDFSR